MRVLRLLLAGALLMCLAGAPVGCGGGDEGEKKPPAAGRMIEDTKNAAEETAEEAKGAAEETTEEVEEEAESSEPE